MSRPRHRFLAVLIGVALLAGIGAAPAGAMTLQRKWTARMGTNGVNGTVILRAYTSGRGLIDYELARLRTNATYSVQIRAGTCAKPGTIVARLGPVRSPFTGKVSKLAWILGMNMYYVWTAARSPSFIVRMVSGTSIVCGAFSFARATRVAVSGLGIDIPVIRGPSGYPPCGVAMYSALVAQPREPGIAFIFAHARTGMFLPLLTRWRIDRGKSLIGRTVRVWTSDSVVNAYRITRVRVAKDAMAGVFTLSVERLWLQTSTGPNTSYPKLIVEAVRLSSVGTSYAASHPAPHPYRC